MSENDKIIETEVESLVKIPDEVVVIPIVNSPIFPGMIAPIILTEDKFTPELDQQVSSTGYVALNLVKFKEDDDAHLPEGDEDGEYEESLDEMESEGLESDGEGDDDSDDEDDRDKMDEDSDVEVFDMHTQKETEEDADFEEEYAKLMKVSF